MSEAFQNHILSKLMSKQFKKVFHFFFLIFLALGKDVDALGQNYHLANTFEVEQGLPSNHIYEICQDKKGFLWITTDNGISRFDGKNFNNYSVKNGLPSNDVLQVAMEKDGTIWVNCYKETPSYFDEVNNKFVGFNENSKINNISGALLKIFVLPEEGIRFYSDLGYVDFVKRKPKIISPEYSFGIIPIKRENFNLIYSRKLNFRNDIHDVIELFREDKLVHLIDTLDGKLIFNRLIQNNSFIAFKKNGEVITYSNFTLNPFSFRKKIIQVPESIKWFSFSTDFLCIIAGSGNLYFYDLLTFDFVNEVEINLQINSGFIDKDKNLWVGTVDNGLLHYNLSRINNVLTNDINGNNLMSVAVGPQQMILGGNHVGQIVKFNHSKQEIITIPSESKETWIRKIIPVKDKIFAFTDDGYSLNYEKIKPIYRAKTLNSTSIKSAFLLNEETIIIGSTSGLFTLNTLTEKQSYLKSPSTRFLNFGKIDNQSFYCIDADGLIYYNFHTENFRRIAYYSAGKQNKPSVLAYGADQLLWVATVKGELHVLKNEKLIQTIPNNTGLPENITNLFLSDNNLWIASKTGLYKLKYKWKKDKLVFVLHKLSKSDGLSSNVINDLSYDSINIYAATDKGISIIPMNIQFLKFKIVPYLISVRINNQKVPISNHYKLKNDEKNIVLQLAGPELSGHFKNFQYSINGDKRWIELEGNNLNISLKGGENKILVRAIDENNNISPTVLKLDFIVAIPFYNKLWFWSLVVFVLTAFAFWLYNSRKLNKQKVIFRQKLELEKQRNKITADLHDDIGATLSSLQINSSVANQLIDKKSDEVKSVLTKIENQAENLADKIGDIIWSMKPGKDEFISLSMRIKNFANDILGSTNIVYKIEANTTLDSLIQDITMRKNIVLFFKEAINNAAKYSKATEVKINLKHHGNDILLLVQDNGVGMDADTKTGNGLANMKFRIEELNGEFKIESSLNKGTKILATIPFD